MRRGSAPQSTVATRDRILEAAILRFSRYSYEAVGLRDIAADVGVDVSYVHRSFGSKERLFAEAVGATISPDAVLAHTSSDLSNALAKQLFIRDDTRSRDDIGPLDIVIRSLSSPEATQVLRKSILDDFIGPLTNKLTEPTHGRAALIAAFLAGVGIFRNVLRLTPLLDIDRGRLESLMADAIKSIMDADTSSTKPRILNRRKGSSDERSGKNSSR